MAQIEMTLGWVIAYVEDPAQAAAFYKETFGLKEEFVVPGEYAQMDTGTTKLGFASYALSRRTSRVGCGGRGEGSRRTWSSRSCTRTWTWRSRSRSTRAASR